MDERPGIGRGRSDGRRPAGAGHRDDHGRAAWRPRGRGEYSQPARQDRAGRWRGCLANPRNSARQRLCIRLPFRPAWHETRARNERQHHIPRQDRPRPGGAALRFPRGRAALAGGVERPRLLRRARRAAGGRAQILRAGDVPLPLREDPHGACAQLHARRRGGALQAGARPPGDAPDGLGRLRPAGRERGARTRHASGASGPTRTSPPCATS